MIQLRVFARRTSVEIEAVELDMRDFNEWLFQRRGDPLPGKIVLRGAAALPLRLEPHSSWTAEISLERAEEMQKHYFYRAFIVRIAGSHPIFRRIPREYAIAQE